MEVKAIGQGSIVSLRAASVGPKADLLGSGVGTMKARKMNSPSVVDSQDSRFMLSDFKNQDRNSSFKHQQQPFVREEVADESAMFNVRQASPDGITPAKVIYALSAS